MSVQIQKTTDHGYLNATDICATQVLYPSVREDHRSGSGKSVRVKGPGHLLQGSVFST